MRTLKPVHCTLINHPNEFSIYFIFISLLSLNYRKTAWDWKKLREVASDPVFAATTHQASTPPVCCLAFISGCTTRHPLPCWEWLVYKDPSTGQTLPHLMTKEPFTGEYFQLTQCQCKNCAYARCQCGIKKLRCRLLLDVAAVMDLVGILLIILT